VIIQEALNTSSDAPAAIPNNVNQDY